MAALRAWLALPISILIVLVSLLPFGESQREMWCAYFSSPKYLTANSVIKSIEVPQHRFAYQPLQHCEWRISTSDPDKVIKIKVKRLDIEGADFSGLCNKDYIDLYEEKDGNILTLGRLCGSVMEMEDKTFESSSSGMTITFISNTNYEYSGFHLLYYAVAKKTKEPSLDMKTELAVSIPIVIIGLCMFTSVLVYVWLRRRAKNRTARDRQADHSTRPGQGHVLSEPLPSYTEVAQYPQTQTRSSYLEGATSLQEHDLQVSLPDPSSASLRGRAMDSRSSTPPPSYEFLVRHEGLVDQQNSGNLMCPPDYETVVKETLSPQGGREMDSHV